MTNTKRFKSPPVTRKENGDSRRVGFELEFTGLGLDQTMDALRSSLGGKLHGESAAECSLDVDSLGTFKVELDWHYLKRKASESEEENRGGEWIDLLSQAAALLVPVEVVCPPIPMTDLDVLNPMIDALREAGAVGTEDSPIAAYGVHINTEVARLDAATILSYLKAFAVLQWWLVASHDVDTARRISPYIALYPDAYLKQLFSKPGVGMDQLFDDYLEHNATRNRALDLLPLLAEIDAGRVKRVVDDPRIKARPAFHYRLPNCHIERADWSLAAAWNKWCVVEALAHRPDELNDLAASFLEAWRPILGVNRGEWTEFVGQWLKDRGLG